MGVFLYGSHFVRQLPDFVGQAKFMNDQVILVDENDVVLGQMDKEEAHQHGGSLHRAASVMLYRRGKGRVEVLLQRRASSKKRWPGFWANTVCTDVRPGETHKQCAVRRLVEEMGIIIAEKDLTLAFTQIYKAKYGEEYWEHEVEAVFVGEWDGMLLPNEAEVAECRWIDWDEVKRWIKTREDVSPWLVKMVGDVRLEQGMKGTV